METSKPPLKASSDLNVPAPGNRDIEATRETSGEVTMRDHPRKGFPKWKWILSLIGLYLGALLYGLDTTIAADVQASVYKTLGDIQNLSWVGIGFPMASVALLLLLGRAYGLFNMKALMLSSFTVFEVGSALCGAAPTSNVLIAGRVIAGMGGAGMYLGGLTYISVFSTTKEAALYNALIGLSWGVGAILGPVVGGAFSVSNATWRWAFYINLPIAGVLSPIYLFIFPSRNPRTDISTVQKLAQIDWVGAVLNGAIFVLFIIVITFGGSTYAWNSGASIALWVIWGLCLIAYVLQQYFSIFTSPERRIFPVHFLKSRSLVLLYISTAAAAAANSVTLFYVPLYFQFTRHDSALQAGVRLLPFICMFIFCVMIAGGLLPVVGRYSAFYTIGGAFILAGGALMFTIDTNTSTSRIYGYEVLIATGTGLVFQNAYAVAVARVSEKDRPNAIGFINVSQIGTIAITLAIAGSLFQNLGFRSLKSALYGFGLPDNYIRFALAGYISPIFSSADLSVVQIAVTAVAKTIQRIFGTTIAAGTVVFVSSFLMRWESLDLKVVAGG